MTSDKKPTICDSMRPVVLRFFVVVWNAPVILWLILTGFTLGRGFERIVILQGYLLGAACIALAISPRLYRFVFRPEVPLHLFRRTLIIGAAFVFTGASVAAIVMRGDDPF